MVLLFAWESGSCQQIVPLLELENARTVKIALGWEKISPLKAPVARRDFA
jgi:hypothetical protein